jgi:hypothetical protein
MHAVQGQAARLNVVVQVVSPDATSAQAARMSNKYRPVIDQEQGIRPKMSNIPFPDLEAEIQARMHPEAQKRRGWAMQALWAYGTFLTGIGVGLALVVAVMIVPVIWAARKMRRAVK